MRIALPSSNTGILLLLLLLLLAVVANSGRAQDTESLPGDFDELIQLKSRMLEQFTELKETGPPDKAIQVLRTIINIHRKALKTAVADKRSDDLIGQLQQVFGNDTEFLSDQLFARGEYKESATLRNEVEQFYQDLLGQQHNSTRLMHWKAVTAEKLSIASKDKKTAYVVATGAETQAQHALRDGQLDVAAEVYTQLIDAQIAVLGEAHPDVAVDLNEFGRVLWMQEKHGQAESVYQRSLRAREATTGRDLQFATTLFNLGRVYQDTDRFAEAEKQFLATAEIEESALGSTDKSFMQTLQQLASLYEQSGDAQKLASIQQRIAAADPLATVISHLPEGTFVAAAIQPSTLPADPGLQLLPFEVIEAAGIKEMGFNPLDVEAIIAFGTLPITDTDPPFHGGFVFKLKDGIKADYPWTTDMQPVKGQPYLKGAFGGPGAMCFVEFNDGAVLLGTEEAVRQSLASGGETLVGTMLQADRGQGQLIAAANLELVRPFVQMVLQDAPPVPPALEELKSIPVDTDTVQLWLNMSQGLNLSLILNSADDRKAARIAAAINSGLAFGQQMAMQEMEFELDDDDPVQAATRAYAQRIVKQYVNKLRPAVTGTSVAVELDAMEQSLAPVAVALLLPAVQAARGAAQQMQDSNSLKQIGLAMHNYHETYRKFPARGNYDRNGKPLLSWRVHLLPFLDQQQLYDQFKLDEPWDSDHNLPLAGQIPDVYRNKQLDDPTRTVFVTLDGKGTFMEGTKGLSFRDFTDGTSNTLMVVETNPGNAVVWTRPEDLVFDQNEPSNGVGLIRLQGFQALFTDGAVQMLSAEIDDETLRRLILRNDGEIVGDF